ncbi:MAG: methyltransferase domain-containing protein, partial [Sphingosinicella sp.]|uniref:methyltransferase domain-containing protein n=1 Tax=Sphingosinicella sp. TaxID=1917971 RepID=UPI004037F5F8
LGVGVEAEVLDRARAKAARAGVEIEWRQGFAHDAAALGERFDKAVSSLVFHQVPLAGKAAGIAAMAEAVRAGGEIHIADFARQRGRLMRTLFGIVGRLDGAENTRPNADGALERILGGLSAAAAEPTRRVATPLGEISLFRLRTPDAETSENALDPVAGPGPIWASIAGKE